MPFMQQGENPAWKLGAAALFVVIFFSFGRLTDFYLSFFHLPLVFSIIALILALATNNLLAVFNSRIGMMFLAFSFWLVACVPTSLWRGGSVEVIKGVWIKSFALFIITGALLRTTRHCLKVLPVFAYSFLTTSLLAFSWGVMIDGRFGMTHGLYEGSNELATAMVQGLIFWWYMVHDPKRGMFFRALSMVPMLPLLYILTQTGSRAGFLAIGVLMIVILLHYTMEKRIIFLLIAMMLVLSSLVILPSTARRRFMSLFTHEIESTTRQDSRELEQAIGSTDQRLHLLKTGLYLTLRYPVFGVGPGQFAVAENNNAIKDGRLRGNWLGTHNTYVQISSEAGIPALIFYVGAMLFCWKELRFAERLLQRTNSTANRERLLLGAFTLRLAFLGYAVFFCFEHIAYDHFFPAMAGVIFALGRAAREEAAATQQWLAAQPQAASGPAPLPSAFPAAALPVPAGASGWDSGRYRMRGMRGNF